VLFNSCGKKENPENKVNDESKLESVVYKCKTMHCSGCEETIKSALNKLDGVKDISADANSKIVKVSFYNNILKKEDIEKTINDAGYDTETSKSENKHNCDMEKK
jgi:copper chaperone CopZ